MRASQHSCATLVVAPHIVVHVFMQIQLRSCMRIDAQCVRENAALLGYLTQVLGAIASVHALTLTSTLTMASTVPSRSL